MELPKKTYSIIYADPPWFYNARNNPDCTRFGKGAIGHYKVMTTLDICNLPIKDITKDNCALFLWVTMPRLKAGLRVLESWGFTYKTMGFSWLKVNKDGKPFFGIGYYTKSNVELCLLGIKGQMKPISNYVSQVVISQRTKHSEKPKEIRDKIVSLFGNLPRIELFARDKCLGWDVWGNEV